MAKRKIGRKVDVLLWAFEQQEMRQQPRGYCYTCHCFRWPHECTEPYAGQPGICCACGGNLDPDYEPF